jgi:hypothetical protein
MWPRVYSLSRDFDDDPEIYQTIRIVGSHEDKSEIFSKLSSPIGMEQLCQEICLRDTSIKIESFRKWCSRLRMKVENEAIISHAILYELHRIYKLVDFVTAIAGAYPRLKFEMKYSRNYQDDYFYFEIHDGRVELIEHRAGWFRLARNGELIHHRTALIEVDDKTEYDLLNRRVLYLPDLPCINGELGTHSFRCNPDELGVPYSNVHEYTLDEDIYLYECLKAAGNHAKFGTPLNDFGAIPCYCPIKLEDEEIQWLLSIETVDDHSGVVHAGSNSELRFSNLNIPFTYPEPAKYLDEDLGEKDFDCKGFSIRRYLQFLFSAFGGGYELSTKTSYNYPVIRSELALLLKKPDLTDERRSQIEEAIQKPNWIYEWAEWEEDASKWWGPKED